MKLRSIELVLPQAEKAADFMVNTWGTLLADKIENTFYIRGAGNFPYLVALEEGQANYVKSVTFVCEEYELHRLAKSLEKSTLNASPVVSSDLGGGYGLMVELKEGEILRFLVNSETVVPVQDIDLPVKLTHVVFNAIDAEQSALQVEQLLDFIVSDRTKGMVFVRCNEFHHSTAFARAGFSSLNHIAFEMHDADAVMRGIGRMRDHNAQPSWGPGRHGPGDNVFAYYIAPFGAVIEYSTAVDVVPSDYVAGNPEDWTWPENRIDQWGISDKDFSGLKEAEASFKFERHWPSASLSELIKETNR